MGARKDDEPVSLYDLLPVVDPARRVKVTAPEKGPPSPPARRRLRVRWCACNSHLPFKWCHGRVAGAPKHFVSTVASKAIR